MSIVLSVYSESAFKEFVLPPVRNAEIELVIDRRIFKLKESLVLHLEEIDQRWSFLPASTCRIKANSITDQNLELKDQANYMLKSNYGEVLSAIVQIKATSFVSYTKYNIDPVRQLTVGREPDCAICYSYQYEGLQYVSRTHTILRNTREGTILEDKSSNGVFVNDVRVQGSRKLEFGDRIHIWGMDMVFLDDILAVRKSTNVKVDINQLPIWQPKYAVPHRENHVERRELYHRAPRNLEVLETEPVEIESPPAPREIAEMPLAMTIGPAMTMAIPMIMSSMIAIMGAKSSGVHASTFMYTGIITSVCSALIGVVWVLMNIRFGRNSAKKEENRRFEAYGEYLIKCADTIKEKYDHNSQALNIMYPSANDCLSEQIIERNVIWNRNSTHPDFLAHRLGIGDMSFQVAVQIPKERFTLINDALADKPQFIKESYQTLHQVPICLDLLKEQMIGIVGGEDKTGVYPIIHALVAQIAVQNCYTDVKMAFVFQEESGEADSRWGFARWLPHTWSQDKKVRYVAGNRQEASDVFYELTKVMRFRSDERKIGSNRDIIYKPHYILFVEEQACLEGELIAKYIFDKENNYGLTVIFMAESYEELPNACECIIQNDREFTGIWNVRTEERTEISFDMVSGQMLERMARRLSNMEVNEVETGGEVPNAVSFFDMYGVTELEGFRVEERWKKNRTYENMKALVGQKAGSVPCYLDVHEKYHGPHGLVAGTTGSGKSETLQTYMLSLAINFSPDDIGFFIIDYKGGGMANLFDKLPHILGQISNLSGNQVRRAMVSIKSENKRRQRVFSENGVNNINAYMALYKSGEASLPIPHLFIIIDEFAELKREESDFMKELISVAQVGRSLGVHLILATQKPSGTVDDNIWSNSKFRLCLRVQERQDSLDMLHKPDAAYLTQAGRCYLQVGNDELYELFQSGWSGAVYDEEAGNSRQVAAMMLTDSGKAALIGGHMKRKRYEEQKLHWVETLCAYLEEGLSKWDEAIKTENTMQDSKEDFLREVMFEVMVKEGIDYPESDYNRKALDNVIQLYDEVKAAGGKGREETAARIIETAEERNKKLPELKDKTQLEAIVSYLAEVAQREGYQKPQQLWLPVLPEQLLLMQLPGYEECTFDGKEWPQYAERWELQTMMGLYDDPVNQAQLPLVLNFSEHGHHAICGITMSGKSTFLQTLAYSLIHCYSPDYLSLYMLDFSSRALGVYENEVHVGGILYESDIDTIGKFFYMIEHMVKERKQLFRGGNYNQYVSWRYLPCYCDTD